MMEPLPLVLVTGASGFVASHCIKQLLELGYPVRGTVRSIKDPKKIAPLQQLAPNAKHQLELVEADLLSSDGWEKAVSGCTYVLHVASPFPNAIPEDEQEVIKPAVEGTLNVLRACAREPGVKRVVVTSSVASVAGETHPDYKKIYNEDNWTDLNTHVIPYQKSKTLAEKAAWDFVNGKTDGNKFELVTVCPTYVMGPVYHGSTGTSQEVITRLMRREMPAVPNIAFEICDVRDVAQAHIKAMTLPGAAGQRFIINSGVMWFKEMAQVLDKEFKHQGYCVPTMSAPKFVVSTIAHFDKSLAMILPRWGQHLQIDNSKMRKVLGIEPRPLEQTVIDMAYTMIEKGMLPKAKHYKPRPESAPLAAKI